jgi:hypothetical protein
MTNDQYDLTIDTAGPGVLRLVLSDDSGQALDALDMPYQVAVDNLLLTAIDNLINKNKLDKSALRSVAAGPGIDKSSSLYRIVSSLASAISSAHPNRV